MRSATLVPALLAIAQAATVPQAAAQAAAVVTVSDETLDQAIAEPLVNNVDGPVQGRDPSSFISSVIWERKWNTQYSTVAYNDAESWAAIELEAAAAIELEAAAALEGSDPEDADADAERLVEARARDLAEIAKGPGRVNVTQPIAPDFHRGITKDQLCAYFHGIAWKTGELQRPVYQWQYEYVPWLVQNKGPYIYVLDGLRYIEWTLAKIERALQYTTNFTPWEERDIIRCYYQFSGFERQVTRTPRVAPAPAPASLVVPREEAVPTATIPGIYPHPTTPMNFEAPETEVIPPGHGKGPSKGPAKSHRGPFGPWFLPHPSLKKLLRIITAKAPVSRYQSYANSRIHNVLQNLDRSTSGAVAGLLRKLQTPEAKGSLIYDTVEGQGLRKALAEAVRAFEV
ncbi:hypothetical protein CH63R_06197 [Colletotrichum higginsianum IMI 349063]|uniref:Uncharacterized protein n=1 Tax=Colletotrichum higginsianum (strain IMI 349063) TaxID=759273 RepID=A0A1B7YEU7_COLHI|nr:hypothetical protein CH63R_06197 [Colletotrichum higginsianum IMI 349063]OBR10505.1 hypothetical protein CH63R_06197 [Colletotrichum higginsianum IMI 349063]